MRRFRSGVSGLRADIENALVRHSERPELAAGSTGRCNTCIKSLCRCLEVYGPPRDLSQMNGADTSDSRDSLHFFRWDKVPPERKLSFQWFNHLA